MGSSLDSRDIVLDVRGVNCNTNQYAKKCMPNGDIQQCQMVSVKAFGKYVREDHWLIDQNGSNTSVLRVPVQELAERRRVNIECTRLAFMVKLYAFVIHGARGSMYHSHGP